LLELHKVPAAIGEIRYWSAADDILFQLLNREIPF